MVTDDTVPLENRIRVLLADANSVFLAAAARFLVLDGDLALVGQAVTGADTLKQAGHLRPDLVLVDIGLGDLNGLEVTRQMKRWPNPPRVVVMALSEDAEYREAARNAGADGFVAKMEFHTQLYRLIRTWYAESAMTGRVPASSVLGGKAA